MVMCSIRIDGGVEEKCSCIGKREDRISTGQPLGVGPEDACMRPAFERGRNGFAGAGGAAVDQYGNTGQVRENPRRVQVEVVRLLVSEESLTMFVWPY